jgi:hypothetical protein
MNDETFFTKFNSWLSHHIFDIILAGIATSVWYFFGVDKWISSVTITCLILVIFFINKYSVYQKRNNPLNTFLANIKSFILNLPPISKGSKIASPIQKLTIIYDDSQYCILQTDAVIKKFALVLGKNFTGLEIQVNNTDIDSIKTDLIDYLENAKTVIVLKTIYFEQNPWIYEVIESWAMKNSEVPFLFVDTVDPSAKRKLKREFSKIPERYNFMKFDNTDLIPFKLLHRATDRSFDWKLLAQFNRRIGLVILAGGLISSFLYWKERKNTDGFSVWQNEKDLFLKITSAPDFNTLSNYMNEQAISLKKEISLSNHLDVSKVDSTDMNVYIWKAKKGNGVDTIYTIGRSDNKSNSYFRSNSSGVIVGSYRRPEYYFWWSTSPKAIPVFTSNNLKEPLGEQITLNDYNAILLWNNKFKQSAIDTITVDYGDSTGQSYSFNDLLCFWHQGDNSFGISIKSTLGKHEFINSPHTIKIVENFIKKNGIN